MLSFRIVQEKDMMLLFQWANDPLVRQAAFHTELISIEDHKKWFFSKLNNFGTNMFILEEEQIPVGQIRFDLEELEGVYYIDYSISEKYRGKGLGKKILILGLKFHESFNQEKLIYRAFVKKNNRASIKCFADVGFTFCSETPDYMVFELDNRR
ncbi:GNAT family N-acetyltransferase [Leptospira borgpetersenii]|uniref:GNAT family N-acetyltransferase n=1 Tax=Leptospira borgpetersenii TaxID=174 RepID=UPI000773D421|nr:GNAT family N-acetyltransferase [Leptospira borgpetersenii]